MASLYIDQDIKDLGQTITLKTVSSTARDDYGDIVKTTTSSSVIAAVSPVSGKDMKYIEAGARVGIDLMVIFQSGVTVNVGDEVVIQDETCTVRKSTAYSLSGNAVGTECFVSKEGA